MKTTIKQHIEIANAALKANEPILSELQTILRMQENELFRLQLVQSEIAETWKELNASMS